MARYVSVETFKRDFWPKGKSAGLTFINGAASAATNIIDAALAGVYDVPFSLSPVAQKYPPVIVDIARLFTKMVVEYMMERGRMVQVTPELKIAMNPMDLLEKIRSRKWQILDADGDLISPKSSASSHVQGADYPPIFNLDDALKHVPDPDLLDEIELERD